MDATIREHTVSALADRLNAEIVGRGDLRIHGLDMIDEAVAGQLTFIGSARHANDWPRSRASAALVTRGIEVPGHDPERRALLYVDNADLAMAEMLRVFGPAAPEPTPGVHATAWIDPQARVDASASIGRGVRIEAGAVVGARSVLDANVYIGRETTIGDDCHLQVGVVVMERCSIGHRVIIQPNAVIGADGFGYRPDGRGGIVKIPHIGTVVIEDDVEIGACTTIDRGKFGATHVGRFTKIDNLCQIAHNVRIGRGCVLASQVGVAGTSKIGDFCRLGGKCGIADHVVLGDRVQVAAYSGVMSDVPAGETIGGAPAINLREFWRLQAALRKLPQLVRRWSKREEAETEALVDSGRR